MSERNARGEKRQPSRPTETKLERVYRYLGLPFPNQPPRKWPEASQPIDYYWASRAVKAGNAYILARYFREAEDVNRNLLQVFLEMSSPSAAAAKVRPRFEMRWRKRGRPTEKRPCLRGLSPSELANLLIPGPEQLWKLEYVGRRGNPGKPDQDERDYETYIMVRDARAEVGKTSCAVDEVQPIINQSRAQIYRSMARYKSKTGRAHFKIACAPVALDRSIVKRIQAWRAFIGKAAAFLEIDGDG
jgi:hypothetical protein